MTNYNNGKIYKLEAINGEEGDIYIGSTTKKHLCQRMAHHKCMYKRWKDGKVNKVLSYELFDKYGIDNVNIILLENVNAISKDELLSVESKYIKSNECINKVIPLRNIKEWSYDNKEHLDNYRKKYYLDNRDDKLEKSKIYSINNSDRIKEYKKQYRIKNKDKIKESINKNTYICISCNKCLTEQNKERHEKTKIHLKNLNSCNDR